MLQLFMLEVKTCAMQFWAWRNEGDFGSRQKELTVI